METKYIFFITLIISIIIQIMSGIIEIRAFFIKVPTAYSFIKELLILELIVQIIEGLFYFWLAYNFTKIYLKKKTTHETEQLEFFTVLKENFNIIVPVLILNWIMLLFGYLGEMKIIPVVFGIIIGFLPFLIYYYIIYINFLTENTIGYLLFWYFFFFWSLYGFVAFLPYYIKNSFYNILDLFSKNFFGLFLSYIIFSGNY